MVCLPAPCTVPGCERLVASKGLCTLHYTRSRTGKSLEGDDKEKRSADEWLADVYMDPNCGCWIWLGHLNDNGYGRAATSSASGKRRQVYAHRFSYEKVHGPIPKGMKALHKCDTPACVNPDHIFIGAQSDNVADMVSKGRHRFGLNRGKPAVF